MTSEQDITLKAYIGLPSQVYSVNSRIGLTHFGAEKATHVENFLKGLIPLQKNDETFRQSTLSLVEFKPNSSIEANDRKDIKKRNVLNSKEREKLFNIDKNSRLKYSVFERINKIWRKYIESVVKDCKCEHILAKCDYHGAYFVVASSHNPSLVGISGIVIQETKNSFKLIDKENNIKIIPKAGTIFAFSIGKVIFKLHGDAIKMNPIQRTKMKFKTRK